MSEIRHIVFDLGRVVLKWEPEIPYRRLIPDEAARKRFLSEVCNHAFLLDTDLGMTWPEAEARVIARHPGEEAMIRAFRPNWHEMVPGAIADTVVILDALLDRGHDVTALTNFGADTFDEARLRFPFLDRFRGVTVSGRVRLAKPDRAIFDRHARDFGLEPGATLFFDDVPANVEGARAAGWNAEQFLDAEKMRDDLRLYGIALG
jgi:2-haloacid dehalogenase